MLTKVEPPKDYYQDQGYYIFKKLIPDDLIDNLIEEYKSRIVSSKAPFYRQSTRWQSNKISPHGYVVSPFMDTHCYDHPNQSIHGIFGHYLPSQYQFGNLYAKSPKVVEYAKHESMNYRLVHRSNSPYKDEFEEQMEWHLVKEAISSGDEKAMGQNWRLRWGPKIYTVARRIKNLLNSKS